MSTDIREQIRELAEFHQSNREPVELHEVEGMATIAVRPTAGWRPRGPVLAAVVLSVVIVIFIGVPLLLSTTEETPPAVTVTPTTPVVPTTDSPTPSTTGPQPTTSTPDVGSLGLVFESVDVPEAGQLSGVVSDGSDFYLIGDGKVFTSTDGRTWSEVIFDSGPIEEATSGVGASAWNGVILTVSVSPQSLTVYRVDATAGSVESFELSGIGPAGFPQSSIAFGSQGAVIFAADNSVGSDQPGRAWYSPDGVEWTDISDAGPFDADWVQLVAVDGGFVAVGSNLDGPLKESENAYWTGDGIEWGQMVWERHPRTQWALFPWRGDAIAYQSHAFGQASLADNPTWILEFVSGFARPFPTAGLESPTVGIQSPEVVIIDSYGPHAAAGGLGIVSITDFDQVGYYEYSPNSVNWMRGALPDGFYLNWGGASSWPIAVNDEAVVFLAVGSTGGEVGLTVGSAP